MKRYIELVCAFGGMIFAVLFGIGFLAIAGWVPPLDPSDTAEQTAQIYRDDTDKIRIGLLICYIGVPFYMAFGAAVNAQTRRIPGVPHTLIQLQVAAFSSSVLLIAGPFMIWWAAAFRPDTQSPEVIQALNDLGWISFLVGWVPFVTWYVITGVAILCDSGATPIYPRWTGYLAFMMGFGQTSASFLVFFKDGAFAWNNLFGWWLPATEFFTWFLVVTVFTVKAINTSHAQADQPVSAAASAHTVRS